jgi:hypothetical protein
LMLASTVQFSRYGRESILTRRVPAGQQAVRRRSVPLRHAAPSARESMGAGWEVRGQAMVARSLRTQQRAEADHPRSRPVPAARVQLYWTTGPWGPANWSMFHP